MEVGVTPDMFDIVLQATIKELDDQISKLTNERNQYVFLISTKMSMRTTTITDSRRRYGYGIQSHDVLSIG